LPDLLCATADGRQVVSAKQEPESAEARLDLASSWRTFDCIELRGFSTISELDT
jgi:hypothetical protein